MPCPHKPRPVTDWQKVYNDLDRATCTLLDNGCTTWSQLKLELEIKCPEIISKFQELGKSLSPTAFDGLDPFDMRLLDVIIENACTTARHSQCSNLLFDFVKSDDLIDVFNNARGVFRLLHKIERLKEHSNLVYNDLCDVIFSRIELK